jgi:hypothetical protein
MAFLPTGDDRQNLIIALINRHLEPYPVPASTAEIREGIPRDRHIDYTLTVDVLVETLIESINIEIPISGWDALKAWLGLGHKTTVIKGQYKRRAIYPKFPKVVTYGGQLRIQGTLPMCTIESDLDWRDPQPPSLIEVVLTKERYGVRGRLSQYGLTRAGDATDVYREMARHLTHTLIDKITTPDWADKDLITLGYRPAGVWDWVKVLLPQKLQRGRLKPKVETIKLDMMAEQPKTPYIVPECGDVVVQIEGEHRHEDVGFYKIQSKFARWIEEAEGEDETEREEVAPSKLVRSQIHLYPTDKCTLPPEIRLAITMSGQCPCHRCNENRGTCGGCPKYHDWGAR